MNACILLLNEYIFAHTFYFHLFKLYFELCSCVYQLTNNHSLPPNTSSPSLVSPEFWANAVSHAGATEQHDWSAHDATLFQHMLICMWGGTGPRFRRISLLPIWLEAPDCSHTHAQLFYRVGHSQDILYLNAVAHIANRCSSIIYVYMFKWQLLNHIYHCSKSARQTFGFCNYSLIILNNSICNA